MNLELKLLQAGGNPLLAILAVITFAIGMMAFCPLTKY